MNRRSSQGHTLVIWLSFYNNYLQISAVFCFECVFMVGAGFLTTVNMTPQCILKTFYYRALMLFCIWLFCKIRRLNWLAVIGLKVRQLETRWRTLHLICNKLWTFTSLWCFMTPTINTPELKRLIDNIYSISVALCFVRSTVWNLTLGFHLTGVHIFIAEASSN